MVRLLEQASRLDTLPNGRQLTHGDYRDASRPLKRIIKQLGNGSWQEGLRVVATNDDAAAEVMQLIAVPFEVSFIQWGFSLKLW